MPADAPAPNASRDASLDDGAASAAWGAGYWTRRASALLLDLAVAQTVEEFCASRIVQPGLRPLVDVLPGVVLFLYWAASELWFAGGTTPAKWVFGLRVTDAGGERPRPRAVLVRALVIAGVFGFDAYAILGALTGGRAPESLQFVQAGLGLAYIAYAVVVIASRRDSALIEDRLTGTAVVRRRPEADEPIGALARPAPRYGRVAIYVPVALALVGGILAAGGPGWSRLWKPTDPRSDLSRGLEDLIARRFGLRSDVTESQVAVFRTGSPAHHRFELDVSVPWAACSDANISAIYAAVVDTIRVDPRHFDELQLRIGSSISGVFRLHKDATWKFVIDPATSRWNPAPADSAH